MNELDRKIKSEFPLFQNRDVVYLDNSATSQKPQCVIDAVSSYYNRDNANPLRGLYELSIDATEAYENARKTVADFIHASRPEEIVFTRNATESLNLIAYSYGMHFLRTDDEIIVSIMEHHSNLLPWQIVAKHTGAKVKYLECNEKGEIFPEDLEKLMTEKTKLVCLTQISNVFGRINDIKTFARIAHEGGALFVCDGAQSVPHIPVDVTDLDVDFLAFSGHKMYGPMGIGALYGKYELLEKMPPFLYGGEMIEYVTRCGATYAPVPHKFEAGTVNAGDAVGLAKAIEFINRYGFEIIESRELALTKMALDGMKDIPHVHVIGSKEAKEHNGIITFTVDGVHPHDVAAVFDAHHIAVRAGHHCVQPLHKHLHFMSTTRMSLAFYNNEDDISAFLQCLRKIRKDMGYGE
ncbi:MAG: SufS family cysteine desulfurase [Lachnospiraceae bacterium]|nr:SufS family cysteine desulfurase [Lachnospiraceae bacterium]